jgi:hypothetical protein
MESVDIVTIVWDSTSAIELTIQKVPQRLAAVNTARKLHSATDNRYGLVALFFRRCVRAIGKTSIYSCVVLENMIVPPAVDAYVVDMICRAGNIPCSS